MSLSLFFDYLGVRLNGAKAGDREITIAAHFPDVRDEWTLLVRNGALSHRHSIAGDADATPTIDRADLDAIVLRTTTLPALLKAGKATLDGDADAVHDFLGLLDDFDFWFDIVTP